MSRIGVLALGFLLGSTAYSQDTFEGDAQPADVLVAVTQFADQVEAVRLHMGKPPVTLNRFQAEVAEPRHVFYQAQTLFRKTNRLGTEVAGLTRQQPPPAPESDILPEDVLRMVKRAQNQLDLILTSLGIEAQGAPPKRNSRTEPKDVFEEIVDANRQLNLMIDNPFRPADVHSQLSLAVAYMGGVLAKMGKNPFPAVEHESNQQPGDVYSRLLDCLVLNQAAGERLGVPVLEIDERRMRRDQSILSDNYDIATMLVSDVAYWTADLEYDDDAFPPTEELRNIFPSHVWRIATVLQRQLESFMAGGGSR